MNSISVVIPTIRPRAVDGKLDRALRSVWEQMAPPDDVIVALDNDRRGAPFTRDRGLSRVATRWVAFLDDDDELYPFHLAELLAAARESGADLVYPWFDVAGGTDPFPGIEGTPFDPANPCQVPVTFLARASVLNDAGGFSYEWDPTQGEDPGVDVNGNRAGEDFRLIKRLVGLGAVIHHHPRRTWRWHHHATNTSGLPTRWT